MTSEVEKKVRAIDSIQGIYIVKPVRKTWLADKNPNHSGAIMFDYAIYSYAAERHHETGLVITGLTDQEAREIEQEMGIPVNSLSPYNFRNVDKEKTPFSWGTFSIKIPKEGLVIDASRSAREKLILKVLQAGTKVAKSTLEYELSPTLYDLVIISSESEAKATKDIIDHKKKAYTAFNKMTLQDMIDFLSVYEEGKYKVSNDATATFIESEIGKIVDKQPEKFLETFTSGYFKTMVFLFKCKNANLVHKQGPKYITATGEVIGHTLLEAIKNLQSTDYQGLKIGLMTKLENRDIEPTVTKPQKQEPGKTQDKDKPKDTE